MNCNTQKGLYYLIIGSIITMIYGLITSITSFFTQDATASMIISAFVIISFIGAIIILIGAILFLLGRKEFGEKHQKNVKNAVIIFCINIIMTIIIASAVAFLVFSAVISTSSATSAAGPFSILIVIMAIVSAVLSSLMYYFALIELENEKGKNILYAAIISSIIISIITSFYIAGMLEEVLGSISTTNSYSSFGFTQNVGKIGILGIITNLLFIYSLYIPYKRIRDGEIKPQVLTSVTSTVPSRICPNCNKNIPFDANICPYCGKKFETYQ